MELVSVAFYTAQSCNQLSILGPFSRLYLFFKYTLSLTLKFEGVQFLVFCACLIFILIKILLGYGKCKAAWFQGLDHPDI